MTIETGQWKRILVRTGQTGSHNCQRVYRAKGTSISILSECEQRHPRDCSGCRGDVIFVEERGIDIESARIQAEAVTIMRTRVTGRRIVPIELSREPMVRGLRFRASNNQLQSIVLLGLPSQGQMLLEGGLEIRRGGLRVEYIT